MMAAGYKAGGWELKCRHVGIEWSLRQQTVVSAHYPEKFCRDVRNRAGILINGRCVERHCHPEPHLAVCRIYRIVARRRSHTLALTAAARTAAVAAIERLDSAAN